MTRRALKLVNYLIAWLCGMLGVNSCVAMYGSPHADFKADGSVSDESGTPIKGIRVAMRQHWYSAQDGDYHRDDTLYTDENGKYEYRDGLSYPETVTLVFEDIDGEQNGGEFESAEAEAPVKQKKRGDHHFYGGAYEAHADITLKKK